jgi:hypothetical protein
MNKEFIPYEQALELRELGFDDNCFASYTYDRHKEGAMVFDIKEQNGLRWSTNTNEGCKQYKEPCTAPLYQQAFRWFREKYDFTYSIGKTNIAVVHYGPTTQLLQDNESYEAAELAAIKWFIDVAKQQ